MAECRPFRACQFRSAKASANSSRSQRHKLLAPPLQLRKAVIYFLQEHTMNEILATAFPTVSPMLADYIWIGGGTLGLILLIVIVVLVMRKV
jgi:hypothetical protein